jgi:alkanesulfonate monooxygenase SsuD/methylene tetrahydromethanopterin reductase-like flavin-dependent oxidoreductase (luciferase family)
VCAGDRAEAERGAELWRFQPKAWTDYVFVHDPVEIMRRAQQEVPLDELVSTFIVSDEPEEHARILQELLDQGVTTVLVHSAQEDQQAVMRFFGERVLPKVRRDQRAAPGI